MFLFGIFLNSKIKDIRKYIIDKYDIEIYQKIIFLKFYTFMQINILHFIH